MWNEVCESEAKSEIVSFSLSFFSDDSFTAVAVTKLNYSWEHICKAAAGGVQSSTKQWKVDNCGAACENRSVHTHTHTVRPWLRH